MHNTTRILAVLTVAGATIALAGCADGASPGVSSSPSAASAQAASTDDLIDAIEADPELVTLRGADFDRVAVGSSLVAPPAAYLEPDGTTPTGFEVDLMQAIGKKIGSEIEFSNAPFQTLITGLTSERFGLVISEMNDTTDRQAELDFVDYYISDIAFITAEDRASEITDPESLCGKTASVLPGSSQSYWVQDVNETTCAGDPVETVEVNSPSDALNNLKTGRQDVYLSETSLAAYTAANAADGTFAAIIPAKQIDPAPWGIGVGKENAGLRDAVQQALQGLIDDGTYGEILAAWDVDGGAVDVAAINGGK